MGALSSCLLCLANGIASSVFETAEEYAAHIASCQFYKPAAPAARSDSGVAAEAAPPAPSPAAAADPRLDRLEGGLQSLERRLVAQDNNAKQLRDQLAALTQRVADLEKPPAAPAGKGNDATP